MLFSALLAALFLGPDEPLRDKTIVAWVSVANLDQRGGSVLTLDNRHGAFDGLVYGEITPKRWMAGSELFKRSQKNQDQNPEESNTPNQTCKLALVTRGHEVTLYRDDTLYASYQLPPDSPPASFDPQSVIVAGMRHLDQADPARFLGLVDDMRVYDQALDLPTIKALQPNQQGEIRPWAWWPFEGDLNDRAGRFTATRLGGIAEVRDGHLRLLGGVMYAARSTDDLASIMPVVPDPELSETIDRARNLRHKLLADPDRPTYHFVTPEDYAMPFDPNGAIYWKGRYHLFYIYQDHGVHKFGHVSSVDMVHWRHHPPALFPTADSPEKGIFSGNCFVNKKGEATMVYHGVDAGNCMATSSDDLLETWTKLPTNPYLPTAPNDAPYRSWDPFGWLEGDTYYTISGGERAAVFKAKELTDKWTYVGDFMHHAVPGVDLREDISCADFFKLGGKDVLICISHRLGARYYVGEWKNEQFYPEVHERMSWSDNLFFAPESLVDHQGRRVMWAWVFDQRPAGKRQASGWSGEMSLPRELTLGPDNHLRVKPIDELKRLRYNERAFEPRTLQPGSETILDGLSGDSFELELEIERGTAQRVGVNVLRADDGAFATPVIIDFEKQTLTVNNEAGPFTSDSNTVTLRVFVDRSIVEAFADDKQAVLRRAYPTRGKPLGVSLFCAGGTARVKRATAWSMFPSNPY